MARFVCPLLRKIATFDFVYTLASTIIKPIGAKLGKNIHYYKISDEFDYGCKRIRTTGVICP